MTYYLGLSYGHHEPSATLIKDNKIIAIAEEERFTRYKHAPEFMPIMSIRYCLKEAGIKLSDIEKIAINFDPTLLIKKSYKMGLKPSNFLGSISYYNLFRVRIKNLKKALKLNFGHEPKIRTIEHHIAHVYSSFPLSGFKNPLTMSVDGAGERTTTLIYKNGEKIDEFFLPNSIGNFYGYVTEWLGFRMLNGEGKVMGLAPYGSQNNLLKDQYRYKDGKYWINHHIYEYLEKNFGPRRSGEIKEIHKNVAWAVQHSIEEISSHLIDYYSPKYLSLAGGVFLNCKLNGHILKNSDIKDIFIQPLSNDAGGSLGTAVYMSMENGNKFSKMTHTYYGPSYTDKEIEYYLKLTKMKYEKTSDPAGLAAELLSKGKIIGWFQGRMEAGPRALGNRSILADPRNPKIKDIINERVKHREWWRPFAPSMLEEKSKKYLEAYHESPFMILSSKVKDDKQKEIPGVVHVDGSTRPQTVNKKRNPLYHKLIKEFYKETGTPVILNTSFNIRGQPIVCTPRDAISTFFSEGIDYLIIGNWVVKK